LSQTARGNAYFRAFRLTNAFLDAYKKVNFSTTRQFIFVELNLCLDIDTLDSLINHRLTFSTILEEIPLKIRTNALLSSFLGTLAEPSPSLVQDALPESATTSAIPPSFSNLDLGSTGLARNLEQIIESIDAYRTEEGNLAYLGRQIGREKARAETYISKRKEENAARIAQGLAPLPEEDVQRLFKIPAEPSRLESMLLLGQVDAFAKSLEGSASTGLVKMYAAKASSGI
jgi:translation initiation factor 3 subunit H